MQRLGMISVQNCKGFVWAWLFIGNPLILLWHCYYLSAVVHPLLHKKRATEYSLSKFEFATICTFAGFLILINGFAGYYYLLYPLWKRWEENRFLRLDPIRVPHGLRKFIFVVAIVLAGISTIFMTFVQFVSPFLTPELYWQNTYRHSCDGMDLRIHLDSANSHSARDIKFMKISTGESYVMRMDPDPAAIPEDSPLIAMHHSSTSSSWNYANSGSGYSFSVLPTAGDIKNMGSDFVPAWAYIRYNLGLNFGEMTYQIYNADDSIATVGEFTLIENFTIPSLMIYGDLRPFSERCVFDPTVEIFSNDAQIARKTVVMKTIQFSICGLLQVCADGRLGSMTAVPVGLLMLQRAKRGDECCRTKYRVPGVEGRSWN